jgi:hypothetical protein
MVTIACPNCSKRLQAPAHAVGKKARCTSCGHSFVLSVPPRLPPEAPAEIVLEPVAGPKANRWPTWAIWSLWCGAAAVVLIAVAAVITQRYVAVLSQAPVADSGAALGAAPPPGAPAPATSLPAPKVLATASPGSAASEPKTLGAELDEFAKMPTNRALQVYFQALAQEDKLESEREPLREKAWQAYIGKFESLFRSRIPKDLGDALKRMMDRSVRHKRVLEIAKMKESDRAAALAKDSAEEQRIWKIRGQVLDEIKQGKTPGFANFVDTNQETGTSLKTLETKLQELQTKVDKYEANLFPRLNHDELAEVRRFTYVYMSPDDDRLKELQKTRDEMTAASALKEVQSRTPPELEAAFRRENDSDAALKRAQEIIDLPSPREQEAARQKDEEDLRKLKELLAIIKEEITRMGLPLSVQADLDAKGIAQKCEWQEEKCSRHHTRSKKLEEYFNASFGR